MRVRGLQDAFSPNTMDRWTGLIFNNKNMTLLGLPHTHGEKWVRTNTRAHTDAQKIKPGLTWRFMNGGRFSDRFSDRFMNGGRFSDRFL